MTSKRHQRRHACERKQAYPTAAAAHAAQLRLEHATGRAFSVYPCGFGNHWHLAHAAGSELNTHRLRRRAS